MPVLPRCCSHVVWSGLEGQRSIRNCSMHSSISMHGKLGNFSTNLGCVLGMRKLELLPWCLVHACTYVDWPCRHKQTSSISEFDLLKTFGATSLLVAETWFLLMYCSCVWISSCIFMWWSWYVLMLGCSSTHASKALGCCLLHVHEQHLGIDLTLLQAKHSTLQWSAGGSILSFFATQPMKNAQHVLHIGCLDGGRGRERESAYIHVMACFPRHFPQNFCNFSAGRLKTSMSTSKALVERDGFRDLTPCMWCRHATTSLIPDSMCSAFCL